MKIIKQIGGNNLINGRSIQCAGACHCALEHLVTLKNSLGANEVMDHSLIPYSLALVQNFEGLLYYSLSLCLDTRTHMHIFSRAL